MRLIARSVAMLVVVAQGLGACSSNSTGPEGAALRVLVVDDIGTPVDRMPFAVWVGDERVTESRTNGRGEAVVSVPEAGDYEVRVTPRAGYLRGVDPLRKQVTVNGSGLVQFIVYREGAGDNPRLPCRECSAGN